MIRKAISSNPNIASQVRRDQWKLLILEPLSKLEAGLLQQPLILVIDALDECEDVVDLVGEGVSPVDVGAYGFVAEVAGGAVVGEDEGSASL